MNNYKKFFKRVFSILIALAIILPMTGLKEISKAENAETEKFTQTLRVHKILQTELKELEGGKDSNYLKDGIKGVKGIEGVHFELYKAETQAKDGNLAVSGGILKEATTGAGGYADLKLESQDAGYYILKENHEKSTYIGENGEVLSGMMAVPQKIKLPLRNENGVLDIANLYPKNTQSKPEITKKDDNAVTDGARSVQLGDTVPFTVETKIPAKIHYKTANWNDRMTEGLTFDKNVKITFENINLSEDDFEITYPDNDSYVIKLKESGLEKINDEKRETEGKIIFKYTAKINSKAKADAPENNTVNFQYGNRPGFTPEPGDNNPVPQKPKDKKITVNKTWGQNGEKAIPEGVSVEFKLYVFDAGTGKWVDTKKSQTLSAPQTSVEFTGLDDNKTYKVVEQYLKGYVPNYTKDENGVLTVKNKDNDNPPPIKPDEPDVIVETGGKKFKKVDSESKENLLAGAKFNILDEKKENYLAKKGEDEYVWVSREKKNSLDEGVKLVELTSSEEEGSKGEFEIQGLKKGVYFLEEIKAPDGYVLKADPTFRFEIEKGTYSTSEIMSIENTKMSIPMTGGIGSAIFVVAGIGMMGLAVISINRRKKLN